MSKKNTIFTRTWDIPSSIEDVNVVGDEILENSKGRMGELMTDVEMMMRLCDYIKIKSATSRPT